MKNLIIVFLLLGLVACNKNTKKEKQKESMAGQSKTVVNDSVYAAVGLQYAMTTKATLGKNLMGAVKSKGTSNALSFCNTKAIHLTDSMATVHNAIITRVSDKPRNPNNQANEEELAYIETFKTSLIPGQPFEPIIKKQNGKVHFYYPIVTNKMCLQCHGKPNEQITPEVMTAIDKLYPEDKAKGYDVDQVRGIWNVVFDENATE